jgi:hypothetical protein
VPIDTCPHYRAKAAGDPLLDVRRYVERLDRPVPSEPEAPPPREPISPRWSIGAVAAWFKKVARL